MSGKARAAGTKEEEEEERERGGQALPPQQAAAEGGGEVATYLKGEKRRGGGGFATRRRRRGLPSYDGGSSGVGNKFLLSRQAWKEVWACRRRREGWEGRGRQQQLLNGNVDILISRAELALFPLAGSSKLRGRGFLLLTRPATNPLGSACLPLCWKRRRKENQTVKPQRWQRWRLCCSSIGMGVDMEGADNILHKQHEYSACGKERGCAK